MTASSSILAITAKIYMKTDVSGTAWRAALLTKSREFLSDHAKLWQRLAAAKDKPFMSDDLAHLLADIIGVAPLEFDEHKSPIRADFNASRKRIANGVDYDEKLKSAKGYELE